MAQLPLFPEVDVSDWDITGDETSGAEAKFWLEKPGTRQSWLLKSVTVKDGHVHGEDWVEKAASHLGVILGVPCARVELAVWRDVPGCISQSLRPDFCQMQPGRVQLERRDAPGYVHRAQGKDHPGHSLVNIRRSLSGVMPPPGWEPPFSATAFDVFAGYVLFDAWIANQDRHDNNWSVLVPDLSASATEPTRLSGSYDHASGLAFGELDAKRATLLSERDGVERWCARGRADRLEGRPKLLVAAAEALELASAEAGAYWLQRLEQVCEDDVAQLLARIPRMSDPARNFACRVLEVNRKRLLNACA